MNAVIALLRKRLSEFLLVLVAIGIMVPTLVLAEMDLRWYG